MSGFHPHDPAYAAWSKRYAVARTLLDRETVTVTRAACPFFPPLSIVYNKLAGKWLLQRDRNCIAAWQLKSRSPYNLRVDIDE